MLNRISALVLLTLFSVANVADSRDDYFREAGLNANAINRKSEYLMNWSQELAARGVVLPIELYPTVYLGRLARDSDGPEVLSRLSDSLAGYAEELKMLQDSPNKIGTSQLGRLRFNQVGDEIEITQTYTVGTRMTVGSGILVAKHWQHNIRLQGLDERLANYVTAESNNPGVQLLIKGIAHQGVFGSPLGLVELPYIELRAGELAPGDRITIHYGAGRNGFKLPEMPVERITLPLYLRLAPAGHLFSVPVDSFRVNPRAPMKLTVSAPSILRTHQEFELRVRVEDEYGNLSVGLVPSLEVLIDGVFQRRIESSSNPVASITGLSFADEGLHRISVRSSGGGLLGISNPLLVNNDIDLRILWANLHVHSNRSDGLQSPSALKREADGVFDLMLVADHDNYVPQLSAQEVKEISLPLARGGHSVIIPGELPLIMALPETPLDHRLPGSPRLVEIKSGVSDHEWLGVHFANLGYRIGFTGSSTSHLPLRSASLPKTAVLLTSSDTWRQALHSRRTYVTSGPKSILLTEVNGAYPGSRVALKSRRLISGEVFATTGIESIELLRNGEVIDHHRMETVDRNELKVKVTFRSASKPLTAGLDIPRNGREWLGFLRVSGASIKSLSAPGFENQGRSAIAINPGEAGRVDFIAWTHGNEQSFVLTLEEFPDEEILFGMNIKEGFEDVDLLPETREPSITPSIRDKLSINDMAGDGVTREIDVNGYLDAIHYQVVNSQSPEHEAFSFVDIRASRPGDYYYIRVRQSGNQTLWSSPVYVGGFDIE